MTRERSGRVGVTAAVGGIAAYRAAERGKAVYMEERIKTEETERNLRECHEVQQCEARPRAAWEPVSAGSFNVFLLFNLEAAWDEGALHPRPRTGGRSLRDLFLLPPQHQA